MTESWKSHLMRRYFNLFPAYRGTGGRLTYISHDFKHIKIKLPLNWRTHNYVNTIYGGSLYGAVDPIYMLMLIKILGNEYVVWDKSASILFKKPGRSTLYAEFNISDEEIQLIRNLLENEKSIDRIYDVDLVDKEGVIHTSVKKTIYIKKA